MSASGGRDFSKDSPATFERGRLLVRGVVITKLAYWPAILYASLVEAMISTAVLAQSAPTSNYTTPETTSAKPVQLGYYASAHKDCTPASREFMIGIPTWMKGEMHSKSATMVERILNAMPSNVATLAKADSVLENDERGYRSVQVRPGANR